jgi:glycosyltransferase involved in cell wall biosynthesis
MLRLIISKITRKITAPISKLRKKYKLAMQTKHVSGPKKINLNHNEVVLVCLLKDAEYYLEHLIEHHRSIGVKHFLLVDNGSTDRTRELFATAPDVTVYSNTLPAKEYECLLRAQIARHAVKGGWFLFADSDELIAFSRGEGRHISEFIEYCNQNKYDAVIGQVLDLFSPISIESSSSLTYSESVKAFNLYSTNDINYYDYFDTQNIGFYWDMRNNSISNDKIKFMFGGIRKEVFGENCCLTTHRLVRNSPHIELYSHPHCSGNIHCADFTFLIRHYKFCGNFWEREKAQVRKADWEHGEDKKRMAVLNGQEDFVISGRQQYSLEDTEELISKGFLECSDRFLEHFPKN